MDVLPEGKQEILSDDNTEDRDVIVEDEKDISIDDHDESTQATPPPSPNEEDQDTDVNTKDDDDFDDLMEVLSDSEIDIENLEEKDPDEIERQRQALLEKKNKILEMMKENFGSEELLQLGVNIEEEDLETRKRGKARRSSYDLSPISTPSSDSRKRRGRPKKMYKKDEYDEGEDLIYDDGRVSYSTPSDNKRGRTTWSLSENKQLLDILQRGVTETQAIFDDMAKYYGSRKSFEHIKNKRSNLLQKATSRNTTMIEILKEDITKMEEQGKYRVSFQVFGLTLTSRSSTTFIHKKILPRCYIRHITFIFRKFVS